MHKCITRQSNEITKNVEIEVCETIYQWVEIDCPLCNTRGYLDGYIDDIEGREHYITNTDCPCCDGRGTIDHQVEYEVDDCYTVETSVVVGTYEEGCISDECCYYSEYDLNRAIDRYKQLNNITDKQDDQANTSPYVDDLNKWNGE